MKHLFIAACCCLASAGFAAEPFEIRGVLPWHNFLCGPTAWNKADYEVYLDNCKAEGINFIGFHNYTGGGERYATYVEPMVRISYRGIVPQAMLDNSLSCRWGALPLRLKEFAFGSQRALDVPRGAEAFGSDCSLLSKTPDEHYRNTQRLMRDVLRMAHDRDIEMAMGFEFGVVPPEYFSLYAAGSCFFWLGAGNMVPNPCHPTSVELHRAALDDLLENYPDIDYVWLWLNEHSFLGVVVEQALGDPAFAEVFRRESGHFEEAQSDSERFVGVWSLEYIRRTLDHLRQKGSRAKLIIGGWGGGGPTAGHPARTGPGAARRGCLQLSEPRSGTHPTARIPRRHRPPPQSLGRAVARRRQPDVAPAAARGQDARPRTAGPRAGASGRGGHSLAHGGDPL